MKKVLLILLSLLLLLVISDAASAREIDRKNTRILQTMQEEDISELDPGMRGFTATAAADTYCLIWYNFELMDWQGWTRLDNTAQIDTFFHVDDFDGIAPGDYGGFHPLEGLKSMWCGSRDASDGRAYAPYDYLCSWENAPGYGNSWNQMLKTPAFDITGFIAISYKICWDSEPDYDFTRLEYDKGDDEWEVIAEYDGAGCDSIAIHTVFTNKVQTKLRFHFTSDGAWSDQDGLWSTDGAVIVDSITVWDSSVLIRFEDFEDEALDQKRSDDGFWQGEVESPYGCFAGLSGGLIDKDPCGDNFGTQIVFFHGSSDPSPDYPGLYNTPFCTGPGNTSEPCQSESVVSPVISMEDYSTNCDEVQDASIPPIDLPELGGIHFRFTVYRDLPLANLVFYTWGIRTIDQAGCPRQWRDRAFVYYGPDKDYIFVTNDVSDLYEEDGVPPDDDVQLVLGCIDMCGVWYDSFGDCASHTPSPWIDNVRLYRFKTSGPQFSWRNLDLFQDNFPEFEFNLESWVRADMANDLRSNDDPVIDPGDSAVVTCSAPLAGGLDTLVTGEPRVYCHVEVIYIGSGVKPPLNGAMLQGTYGTWQLTTPSGWDIFLCDQARVGGNPAPDRYAIDLNDSLFTRGYMINYYFKAYDFDGNSSTCPEDAESGGNIFEWTCLPTLNSGVLYVDDFHGRGTFEGLVQTYFDPAFFAVIPGEMPDRYDVNNPSSLVSNGPGSRAKNYHMTTAYEKVVWDSGNLDSGTITEGTSYSDKSNDCQLLVDWLDLSEHKVGLWVLGDDVAEDLDGAPTACPLALMATFCGVALDDPCYYELTGGRESGGVVTPVTVGVGIYAGLSYWAYGGCPIINCFDVLEKTGLGEYSLRLPDYEEEDYYIGISCEQLNSFGYPMRTSWVGHSFMYVRTGSAATLARNEFVKKTWEFFENDVNPDVTVTEVPAVYALAQNYPNPFNPATRIEFDLPRKGHVSLKVYNVAGQLVKVLTDEVWEAGSHAVDWNGKNDLGASVASGVYFYRIKAGEFESNKKMVLLR